MDPPRMASLAARPTTSPELELYGFAVTSCQLVSEMVPHWTMPMLFEYAGWLFQVRLFASKSEAAA